MNQMNIYTRIVVLGVLAYVLILSTWAVSSTTETKTINAHSAKPSKKLPKWQLGVGAFYGSTPHYPASNHMYTISSPAPLFIYRFEKATVKRRELSFPITDKLRAAMTLGFSVPVGKNDRSADSFPSHSNDPNKRIVTEDNYHRRGMEEVPTIFKLGGQLGYQINPYVDVRLPLFFNLGLNKFNNQGYEFHPELTVLLRPELEGSQSSGFNLAGSVEIRYADQKANRLYYAVNASEAIEGRPEYQASAGELSRSFSLALRYRHVFNSSNSMSFFVAYRHKNYGHSANTSSPLHIVNDNDIIATGFSYFFYNSEKMVNR